MEHNTTHFLTPRWPGQWYFYVSISYIYMCQRINWISRNLLALKWCNMHWTKNKQKIKINKGKQWMVPKCDRRVAMAMEVGCWCHCRSRREFHLRSRQIFLFLIGPGGGAPWCLFRDVPNMETSNHDYSLSDSSWWIQWCGQWCPRGLCQLQLPCQV